MVYIKRYAIQMKNGSYMKQDFDCNVSQRVKVWSVDHPVDADFFKDKETAERCVTEILTGNTNLLVLYDNSNPPFKVVELSIKIQIN